MPFGVSWLTYSKYWGAAIAGFVCGSQIVHFVYKPLEGWDEEIEKQYQTLRAQLPPPPTLEERVARFDDAHKKLEEYERKKEPIKILDWFAKKS